jgi:hypothetical protein
MWSHYAAKHAGVCLEFSYSRWEPFFGRAQPVSYSEQRPIPSFLRDSADCQVESNLLTKAAYWAYEKEWRIVDHDHGFGVQILPKSLLTGLVFGCRTAQAHKEQVLSWLNHRSARVNVFEAHAHSTEYRLEIIPLGGNKLAAT